jgi:hypothetical protein
VWTAPSTPGSYTITATSVDDPSKTATTTANVVGLPVASLLTPSTTNPLYKSAVTLTPTFAGGTAVIGTAGVGSSDISASATSGVGISTPVITSTKTYTLTVTNASLSQATATCTVTPQTVSVTNVSPATPTVTINLTKAFSVTTTGGATNSVNWSATGGSFTANVWTAPATPGTYTISATSVDDPSKTATTAATVVVSTLASSLIYTDPASGLLQLKKNVALSTPTHLVLDLIGTASLGSGSGISATFTADTTVVTWTNVGATAADVLHPLVQNVAFSLGAEPQILKGRVVGPNLQVVSSQKGTGLSPVALTGTLLRIALDLKSGQAQGTITLTADGNLVQVIDGSTKNIYQGVTIGIGTLLAQ